jgi:antitoxin component YwqK of YwqJK toxin-antitoxin module
MNKHPRRTGGIIALFVLLAVWGPFHVQLASGQEVTCTNIYLNKTSLYYSYCYYMVGTNVIRHGWYQGYNAGSWTLKEEGMYSHGQRTGEWRNYTWSGTTNTAILYITYVNDRRYAATQFNINNDVTLLYRWDLSRPKPTNYDDLYAWVEERLMYPTSSNTPSRNIEYLNTYISQPVTDGSTTFYTSRHWTIHYFTNGVVHYEKEEFNYLEPSPVLRRTGWQQEGIYREYHANGQLRYEEEYAEGRIHGRQRTWADNGVLTSDANRRWGVPHGPSLRWYSDGRPWTVGQHSDGQNGTACANYTTYYYGIDEVVITTTNLGPCAPPRTYGGTPPAPPPDPGTPDTPNKTIYGMVCNAATGARLGGVAVQAGGATTTTDTNGFYSLAVGDVNVVTVQFTKNTYRTSSSEVLLNGVQSKLHNVNMISTLAGSAITGVESQYGLIFIGAISVNNTFTAQADWGGESPGRVIFDMNGAQRNLAASGNRVGTVYDMGYDLKTALNLRANTLAVYSVNANGERSPNPFVLHPIVLPVPKWSTKLGPLSTTLSDGVVTYKLKAEYPEKPMAIEISPEALGPVLWTAWGLVPVVGGQSFGIPPSQVGVDVSINSKGQGGIGGSGKMAFKAAGGEIEVNVNGKGLIAYDLVGNNGFEWKGAEIGGGVKGTIKRQFGPVTVIPALAGAVSLPIVGRPITWFNDRAKIDASVSLGGDLKFNLVNKKDFVDEIVFDSSEGKISSGVELGLGGDLGKVKARVSGGGSVGLTYQLPAAPGYLKKAEAEVTAKLKLTVWSYETTLENSKSLVYPSAGGSSMPMALAPAAPGGFRLLDTSFVKAEPYAAFASRGIGLRALRSPGVLSSETPFVSNIFPFAEPAFASRGTNHAVVYVVYDPAKPVTQGNELRFSFSNGGSWSVPAALTSDTRNDYAPAIAFAPDGKLVAVWERVRAQDYNSGNVEDLPPQLEIAWSIYDPAVTTWSAPAFLTDDAVMDFSPMLAEAPSGGLALCWLKSPGGQLIGTAAEPISVQTAVWQGSGFGPVTAHPHAFSNAFDLAFAYDGDRMKLAWIQDADGDLATAADQRLQVSTRSGGTWSAPAALFASEGYAAGPSMIATGDDQWALFWQQDTNLVRLTNWTTPAYEIFRTDSAGLGFANLLLRRDVAGRLLIAWEDLVDETPDLYARVFDGGVWSEDLRLTDNEGREAALAGALCDDAVIRLFYTSDRTNDITDLYYAEHALHRNLTADAAASSFEPAVPVLGEPVTISAAVRNTGNLSITNLYATFYLGIPGTGGVVIGQAAVQPLPLAAGTSGMAVLSDWSVPENIGLTNVIVVFDHAAEVIESDETDNTAVLSPVWIDLAVTEIVVGETDPAGNVVLTGTIENRGNAIARSVRVQPSLDDRTVSTNTVVSVLLPGRSIQLMWMLTHTDFRTTQSVIRVIVDPNQLVADIDRSNNTNEIIVNRVVGFDTGADGISDDWKRKYFGHINVLADDDDDGDGESNYREYLAGTDPLDPDSVFAVTAAPVSGSTDWQVSWPVAPSRRYQVYRSENLEGDGYWQPLQAEFTGWNTGTMILLDQTVPSTNRAFYRLRLTR